MTFCRELQFCLFAVKLSAIVGLVRALWNLTMPINIIIALYKPNLSNSLFSEVDKLWLSEFWLSQELQRLSLVLKSNS